MKYHLFRRLTALACSLALSLSLLPAAQAAERPAESRNINRQDYTTWASTVKSYLYENEDGGLTRVELIDGRIVVEDYSASFALQSSRTVPMELSIWGGFYAGEDFNFLIFGQRNPGEDDSQEVIRVVKYSKDWERLGQASLKGANTVIPFDAGSLRCDEYGGYLYIRTCHEMYASNDGLNHQSNLTMAVRQSDMSITDAYYDVMNISYGYVSHSFNQFILVDQDGKIIALDHGDAYPRSAVLVGYYSNAGSGKFSGSYGNWCWNKNLLSFGGAAGNNTTGASVGGLEETSDGYVMAYSYNGTGGSGGDRTVYFQYMDKAEGTGRRYTLNGTAGTTPVLAPTGLEGGYLLWNEKHGSAIGDTLCYLHYGVDGTPGEIQTATGALSDCQPVFFNGQVVWYVTDDSAPVFYTLDSSGVQAHPTAGSSAPEQPGEPEQPVEPEQPDDPEQPNQPDEPQAPSSSAKSVMTSPNITFVTPGYNGLYLTPDGTLKSWYHAILHGKMVEDDYTPRTLGTGYRAITSTYLLKEDGTLWLYWDGDIENPIYLMDNVKQICGDTVLKNDGTVWSTVPQEEGIPRGDTFFYVTSGGKQVFGIDPCGSPEFAYVLKEDGSLWSWGCNEDYMLGRDTGREWGSLGKVMDDVAYATGGMAIKTDGSLWSWGTNDSGQVGNGTSRTAVTPVKIMEHVSGIWSFGTDGRYRFALTEDGDLYSWGSNLGWNPLGYEGGNEQFEVKEMGHTIGYISYQTVPRKVDVDDVVAVSPSSQTTVILKSDGSLWACGRNIHLPITEDKSGLEGLDTFTKFLDGVAIPEGAAGVSGSGASQDGSHTPSSSGGASGSQSTEKNPFVDVAKGTYYYDAVLWALENDITRGVTATRFQPSAACTRGQVVTFLWRAKGCPEPETKVNPFRDVSENSAFYKAILWAYENRITTGASASTFNPNGTCSSAHVVTFLWRANGEPAASGSSALASANPGRYYTDAVAWADSTGLLSSTGKAFVPGNLSPRADIVTYLYRDLAD